MAVVRFCLLGTAVTIHAPPEAHTRLETWYGGFTGTDPGEFVEATVRHDEGIWSIHVEGRSLQRHGDLTGAIRSLNHELMHALMLRQPGWFYVHAGVVAVASGAIVLPGLSRAGKSTLVLALVQRGARFLSDELLVFDPPSGNILPFPRAIKIRDECAGWFQDLEAQFCGSGEGRCLPLSSLPPGTSPGTSPARTRPHLIVAPTWDPLASNDLLAITTGQGLLELTRSALNLGSHRSQESHGIDHLAVLVEHSPCYTLRWNDPHAAADRILAAVPQECG